MVSFYLRLLCGVAGYNDSTNLHPYSDTMHLFTLPFMIFMPSFFSTLLPCLPVALLRLYSGLILIWCFSMHALLGSSKILVSQALPRSEDDASKPWLILPASSSSSSSSSSDGSSSSSSSSSSPVLPRGIPRATFFGHLLPFLGLSQSSPFTCHTTHTYIQYIYTR